MAEMVPPLSEMHPMKALFQIPANPPPTLSEPNKYSEEFRDFLSKCLVKDPKKRWTAVQLLEVFLHNLSKLFFFLGEAGGNNTCN